MTGKLHIKTNTWRCIQQFQSCLTIWKNSTKQKAISAATKKSYWNYGLDYHRKKINQKTTSPITKLIKKCANISNKFRFNNLWPRIMARYKWRFKKNAEGVHLWQKFHETRSITTYRNINNNSTIRNTRRTQMSYRIKQMLCDKALTRLTTTPKSLADLLYDEWGNLTVGEARSLGSYFSKQGRELDHVIFHPKNSKNHRSYSVLS